MGNAIERRGEYLSSSPVEQTKKGLLETFRAGSFPDIATAVEREVTRIATTNPDAGLYMLSCLVADNFPSRIPQATFAQVHEAARQDDEATSAQAAQTFVYLHLKTIKAAVERYTTRSTPQEERDDLIAVGIEEVAEKARGDTKFADPVQMSAAMRNALMSYLPLPISRHLISRPEFLKVRQVIAEMSSSSLTGGQLQKIAAWSGMTFKEIQAIYQGQEVELRNEIPGENEQEKVEDKVVYEQLRATVGDVVRGLAPGEQYILKSLYGFEGDAKTHAEIAEELGIDGDRVKQIESVVMRKLKYPSRQDRLEPFRIPELSATAPSQNDREERRLGLPLSVKYWRISKHWIEPDFTILSHDYYL